MIIYHSKKKITKYCFLTLMGLFTQLLYLLWFSCTIFNCISDSPRPHGLQNARLPCPLSSPWVCSNSSFESVIPCNHLFLCHSFFLLPSLFLSIRVFPVSWLFLSGSQSIQSLGIPFNISPFNEYSVCFPLRLTGLISLLSKELSRIFLSAII